MSGHELSSWGIKDIEIRMTFFCADGFRIDFDPKGGRDIIGKPTGVFTSYSRAALFQLDLNTALRGAYSSARNARYHWNFVTDSLDEDGYWTCVEDKQRSWIDL